MSSLFPLPSSHLYPIRKLYESPTFDITSSSLASTSAGTGTTLSSTTTPKSRAFSASSLKDDFGHLRVGDIRNADNTVRSAPPELNHRTASPKQPEAFYAVSYIRGEWMQKLLELDLGKRKIRYWLSDEVLCLGSQTAPITSEFSSGLSLYEAYKHGQEPSSASVYMSEEQVTWLVDELYSALGAKNSKITYEDINIDEGKKVSLKDFVALRPVSFRNNVAGFRRKCGIPMITKAMMAEQKQSNGVNTLAVQQRQTNGSNLGRMQTSALSSPTVQSNTRNTLDSAERASSGLHGTPRPRETESVSQSVSYLHEAGLKAGFEGSTAVKSQAQAKPPDATAPKAFVSLTKAERQARLQAQREELLRKHLEQQRISLPSHRRFYRNLVKYGGAALACDVESWTEDAEVLLELGMSWIIWEPSEGNVSGRKREGGNCHYIIEETIQYSNEEIEATRWDYTAGKSETLPQNKVSERLRHKISELSRHGPLILVFHDASAETRYFQKLGVDSDLFYKSPPSELATERREWPSDTTSNPMIIIQDTQNLYAGWSNPQVKQVNLGKACLTFGMIEEARKLHNAGNDAFATLRLWEVLVGMEEGERQQVNRSQTFASEKAEALKQKKAPDVLVVERELEPIPAKGANEADFPDLIELW